LFHTFARLGTVPTGLGNIGRAKRKRPAPVAFFVFVLASLLPAAATTQQTVDGLRAALEIGARSSYVPDAPFGARSRFPVMRGPKPCARRIWNCRHG
jgi:hypothetical protein